MHERALTPEEEKQESLPSTIKQKHLVPHSYTQYLKTLRKFPSDELNTVYLKEIDEALVQQKHSQPILTTTEKYYINGRRIWSDVVSDTDRVNTNYKKTHDVKAKVFARLQKIGHTENLEQIYLNCIDYLKNNTAIVVSFPGDILKKGLENFQAMHTFETSTYFDKHRHHREDVVFQSLSPEIRKARQDNIQAYPRYGALFLLSPTDKIQGIPYYGTSYVVLKKIVKFNSVYLPEDSYTTQNTPPVTYHHFDLLLLNCDSRKFKSIVKCVTTGYLNEEFDHVNWFIEAMLPAFNVFDPNLVEHIHIDIASYELTADDKAALKDIPISISNEGDDTYYKASKLFIQYVEKEDFANVQSLLENMPSLMYTPDKKGLDPMFIAAKKGYTEIVDLFIKNGIDVNRLSAIGYAIIHYSVTCGHVNLLGRLLKTPSIDVNLRISNTRSLYNGMTPLFLAAFTSEPISVLIQLIRANADVAPLPTLEKKLPVDLIQEKIHAIKQGLLIINHENLVGENEEQKAELPPVVLTKEAQELKLIHKMSQQFLHTDIIIAECRYLLFLYKIFNITFENYTSVFKVRKNIVNELRSLFDTLLEQRDLTGRLEIMLGAIFTQRKREIAYNNTGLMKWATQSELTEKFNTVIRDFKAVAEETDLNVKTFSEEFVLWSYQTFLDAQKRLNYIPSPSP